MVSTSYTWGCIPVYKDTVTLFNRTSDGRWIPTVLKGVNLNMDRASIVAKYGEQAKDSAVLNIPYTGDKIIAGKPWKPPKEWEGADSVTLRSGNEFDFFWLGEWTEGEVSDSDYKGGFYQYMNKTHDYVFAVSSVAWFTVIPHFEVVGR